MTKTPKVKEILRAHAKVAGKLEVKSKVKIKNIKDLSLYYTPGVGLVSSYLVGHKNQTKQYTIKGNTVAVISDGSAVLGLGNIGPEAALPVMEGKALLFKEFADVNAFPLVLNTQDTEEIIQTIKNIAPGLGGINLEDISAPRCFEIEERLKRELDIPVMHDDQHGTAIVVLAGLINAFKVVKKNIKKARVVIIGSGAAGVATAKMLHLYNVPEVITVDSKGIVVKSRTDLNKYKKELARYNRKNLSGGLEQALEGADAVIGVSRAGALKPEHIKLMAKDPIVFAMANPVPEIMPDEAKAAGAKVVATGRSDFPNQINNVLAFPGVFRGALDNKVTKITDKMKIKAAEKIAGLVSKPGPARIIPAVLNKRVVKAVASAIK